MGRTACTEPQCLTRVHFTFSLTCISWNPKVHSFVNEMPPLFPILRKMNPVQVFPDLLLRYTFMCPSTPSSSKHPLSSDFPAEGQYIRLLAVNFHLAMTSLYLGKIKKNGNQRSWWSEIGSKGRHSTICVTLRAQK